MSRHEVPTTSERGKLSTLGLVLQPGFSTEVNPGLAHSCRAPIRSRQTQWVWKSENLEDFFASGVGRSTAARCGGDDWSRSNLIESVNHFFPIPRWRTVEQIRVSAHLVTRLIRPVRQTAQPWDDMLKSAGVRSQLISSSHLPVHMM